MIFNYITIKKCDFIIYKTNKKVKKITNLLDNYKKMTLFDNKKCTILLTLIYLKLLYMQFRLFEL